MFIRNLTTPLQRNAIAQTLAAVLVVCSAAGPARGQFVSFNDHYSGPATHANATTWNVFGTTGGAPGTSGPLRDITSGATLGVVLTITTNSAVQGGTTSGAPSPGTPAFSVFNSYIDFGNGTLNHAIQIPAGANVSHTFTGLNPAKRYSYKATGIRGEATGAYTNRWTLFELAGAASFVPAHSANAFTNALPASQVALNTGNNNTPTSGDILDWENIAPDTNGTITITATQFTGAAPGNSPLGPYGYGIQAERLEEFVVAESAVAITAQPTNQTVVEGRPALFTVSASGIPAPGFQWYKGETLIPNATNANYSIPAALLADNGSLFKVVASNVASNVAYSVTSSNATLTVLADTNPPTLVRVLVLSGNSLQLTFSEPVQILGATNPANYSITSANGNLVISNAVLALDQTNLTFATSLQLPNNTYTLTANNVRDLAATPNTIAPNSTLTFVTRLYNAQDIGNPGIAGSIVSAGNGFDVSGSGSDFAGTSDQFQFSNQPRTGNFDVQVRVQNLRNSDVWAKAALMAREDLNVNTRFAAAVSTPSISGSFFESRITAGAATTITGTFPPNYPQTWLRLSRNGNVFTGYAGYDGQVWYQLGSVTMAVSNTIYLGLAVTSHDTNSATTAQFRDIISVTNTTVSAYLPNPYEPPGPSSRKTGFVITEIMYKAAVRTDTNIIEYVELLNSNPFSDDISGWRIAGDIDYTFPNGTVIPGGGIFVIAKSPGAIQSVYGVSGAMGPYSGSLGKSGTIRLRDKIDSIVLEVNYSNQPPWPNAADGTGHSIALVRPSYGENDPRAWAISDLMGGSPGILEGYSPSALRNVVINEFLAHTDLTNEDYVELYNHSTNQVDISGCILTDDATTNKFIVPSGTILPARGFVSYPESQLGFSLNASGETIFLKNPSQTRILDAVSFDEQANGVSFGRFPDGAGDFYPLRTQTPGLPNSPILVRDIVINEIMYDPISLDNNDQYVELYNKGTNAINLGGWKFTSGISFTFPANTILAPDTYLVVGKSITNLFQNYPNLNPGNTLGNYGGTLSHGGERLALSMPDLIIKTNDAGIWTTNTISVIEDEVTYGTGGRWGQWASGGGSSLELKDPRSNHRQPSSWADSDESNKSVWTNIEATAILDNGSFFTGTTLSWLQIGLLNSGECLIDNVELISTAGVNVIPNPTFDANLNGWIPLGDHYRSSLEIGAGFGGSGNALHVRSSGQFWTGRNNVQASLSASPGNTGQTNTIRFKARWLKGWTEPIARVNGNWMEATGTMPVPKNLGTPGARNSRAVTNAGPAIYEVAHAPALPSASQPVVVTARIQDPNGVAGATLFYRLDTIAGVYNYVPVAMNDGGTSGDLVAGDGIYSATIPGQSANTVVAFYVQATNGAAVASQFPSDLANNGPVRECVVLFGDGVPITSFGSYHLWISKTNVNLWANLTDMNNEEVDCTFVANNRIIYNMGGRFAGSPYHQSFDTPVGSQCHYHLDMPDDDKFLGTTSFNKIHAPGNGPYDDNTLQREQTCYFFVRSIGLPWNYRRYVALYVNGLRRGTLMEDTQVPNGDVIAERFPDDQDGELFKLQPWFEFDAATAGLKNNFENKSWCMLNVYNTTDATTGARVKKLARYRYNFLARGTKGTANNFTNVYKLVDAVNLPVNTTQYLTNMDALVDSENWMRTFAVEHAVGNWDSVGAQNAQNMYGYKPENGKWNLLIWDYNIVLGNSSSWTPGQNVWPVLFTAGDTGMSNIYTTPKFVRAYFRALKDIANGPMTASVVEPMMDSKFNQFTLAGVNVTSPDGAGVKTFISQARTALQGILAGQNANTAFTLNNPATSTVTNNYVILTGLAPVDARTITINGVEYPIAWSSPIAYSIQVPLKSTTNVINIQGYDFFGNALSNVTGTINVNTAVLPQDFIAINEIMYNPPVTNASYVEIYNRSSTTAFDLSGMRLDPLGFTFPPNSMIAAGQALALVKNPAVFTATYGSLIPIAGVFTDDLSPTAMTLTLLNPGPGHSPDVIIDRVRYENTAPWPAAANGLGPALQLVDAGQDNARVSNWSDGSTWRYYVNTNLKISTSIDLWLTTSNSDLYIDNLSVVIGSTPEVGSNLVQNGGFEAGTNFFRFIGTHTNSSIATDLKLSGSNSLHVASGTSVGSAVSRITQNLTGAITTTNYTLSFWYLSTTNSAGLTVRFGSATNFVIGVARGNGRSPAAVNTVAALLPPYPTLWLNEAQADNITGIVDGHGEHEPWIEIYNAGTNTVSLSGLSLANNYENLTLWTFPSNAVLAPHEFKVIFADAQPEQSTDTEWHANFRLSSGVGRVALSRLAGAVPQIVDYLNYTNLAPGHSFGAFPDGQAFSRQDFFYVTPGGTNDATLAPIQVYINEWMASNTRSLTNAANGNKLDDWFEIYNPGTNAVSLAGYYLTDNLTNKTQFLIPAGYSVPPLGFLLVWADNKPSLNSPSSPELHVNFSLDKGGEAIGLFIPDGTAVDAVVFGPQASDVSQGHYPDGTGPTYTMLAPTPKGPNIVSANQPPILGIVPDVHMDSGEYVYFPINASDSQVPPQSLTFTLLQGPAGATLDHASGLFSYTALSGTYSASNLVVFQVADNGFPSLSATQSFNVFVRAGNSPPVLNPIASRAIHAGATVVITNTASDPDVPANVLTFSLDPGAAAGALLNAITGVFTWQTSVNNPPGTNSFTIRVTDDGVPNMSATQSFSIVVREPLRVRTIQQSGAKLTLTWDAIPGQTYQVEYKTNLEDPTWLPTGPSQTASTDTLTFEITPADQASGFYSLRLIE